jgi:Domain of unknown function (DUF4349)/Putative zinc-finger
MKISQHAVLPEEVMAFLDGELPASDAQAVSAHIDRCAECARLARQFDRASQSLSAWNVPPVPTNVEDFVLASRSGSDRNLGRSPLFIRISLWNWKQWVIVSGGALAALLLAAGSLRTAHRSSQAVPAMIAYDELRGENAERGLGKLQAEDSNGLFHGLGNTNKGRFSIDGQPAKLSPDSVAAPMIARTVSLAIVVKDFAASRSSVDTIVERHRGYSAQLNVTNPENAARALEGSLRVPAAELSGAVRDLRALGRVENESQSGEEVTRQHEDLVARLRNARETERRFIAILQERTGKVGDVLQVEEHIARVRGDIERMEAEQKALERRVDFATIELRLAEEYKAELNPPAASVATRLHNSFVAGYHGARETLLGIILFLAENGPSILIWLAILALPALLLWRRYRRSLSAV